MTNEIEHLFMYLLAICMVYFVEMPIQFLSSLLSGLLFFAINLYEFFACLGYICLMSFSKVEEYKINIEYQLYFYILAINYENEIKTTPFIIASKIKLLEINLIILQGLYTENYTTLVNKLQIA